MNKTKIEWTDYTINPIKGLCQNNCWYCYARAMYKRFKWNPKIKLDIDVFNDIHKLKKPSKIFVGSMHDIFGNWIPHHWIKEIIDRIGFTEKFNKHIFIFLTKFPERYKEFPPFPENCWLGTTITGEEEPELQYNKSYELTETDNLKFLSLEPLLGNPVNVIQCYIDWVIIGGLTPRFKHKEEWVSSLIGECRDLEIPIFLKPNLKWHKKIQEFPDSNNIINDKEIK